MAFLLKNTVPNLVKSRNVITPIVSRAFAYRTLEIDPVSNFKGSLSLQKADNKQHSDAQWRLAQTPVIEVSEPAIICDGGTVVCNSDSDFVGCGPMGHPMQYLRMNGPNGGVNRCQYCGQRYKYVPKH